MAGLYNDVRFGLRVLVRSPAYTCVAIAILAIAIAANTAIFSAVNRVLLRSLPFAHADRLVFIFESHPEMGPAPASYLNYLDYRAGNSSFDAVAATALTNLVVTGKGEAERVAVEWHSDNLLPMLGVAPALGRNFLPEESVPHGKRAVILSHGFWTRRFAADPAIVGSALTLDGKDWTIVGVMPAGFHFMFTGDIVAPLDVQAEEQSFRDRHARFALFTIGRLKEGVTLAEATDDMVAVGEGLSRSYPEEYGAVRPMLQSLHSEAASQHRGWLLMMMCAVVCVLLIAIANVANLMLERAMRRQKEMCVRAALGAGRWRLIRQ